MPIFVVQDHHARTHHYDFRLEHQGVLKSWAVPKGVPTQKGEKRLALETEDHPMPHADFESVIEEGVYGANSVGIWDKGSFDTEEWSERTIVVNLHGKQIQGRYCLLRFSRAGPRHWLIFLL